MDGIGFGKAWEREELDGFFHEVKYKKVYNEREDNAFFFFFHFDDHFD